MTKDFQKLFLDFKEEFLTEFKSFKDAMERALRSEDRGVRTEMDEMKVGLNHISKCLDEANERLKDTLKENKSLKKENEELRQRVYVLNRDLSECQTNLIKSEQYTRNKNLEVKGVIQEQSESIPEILKAIGKALGEPILPSDVDVCHRVPTKNKKESNIIVQFQRCEKRDKVLEKSRKTKLTNEGIGLRLAESTSESEDTPIFVNEHLCPYLKKLLGMAVARKREHNWRYVWTKKGRIFARRTDSSDVVSIQHESDLDKIISEIRSEHA
ncbi:hypothetical protein HPB48_016251 [Haemaphysalis longicornis]|uniref:FP protein C-terminal domain-containing protein n=1 Tax=Haemaphysalis longicornis TaxID=44386 RepID=A0A9J6FPN2_HAELO|nr:hypothetical protein HPB48_016251 [Haemaphysalis longicornis]